MQGAHSWEGQGGQMVRDAAGKASVGAGLAGVGAAEQEAPVQTDLCSWVGGDGKAMVTERPLGWLLTPQRQRRLGRIS